MRGMTNLRWNQKGIVNFLLLAGIAVLLIGFVGYVSVKRLKSSVNAEVANNETSSVLAANTSTSSDDSMDDLKGDELDNEMMELDKVDDTLNTDIPEVDNSMKDEVKDSMVGEGSPSGEKMMSGKVTRKVKFLGLLPLNIEVTIEKNSDTGEETVSNQPFYLKYLGFLFTME